MLHKILRVFVAADPTSAAFMTAASVLVVGYVWTCCLRRRRSSRSPEMPGGPAAYKPRRVLLITAHPDDECMFFGPVIRELSQTDGVRLYLMCLSVGDFQGKGPIRKAELFNSCRILGIEEGNIMLCKNTLLPDNPHADWDTVLLSDKIVEHIEQLEIDTVLTFDRYGVSGHRNHVSIYMALFHLVYNKLLPDNCHLYALDSVNILRKYIKCIDRLFNNTSDLKCSISTPEQHCVTKAMQAHCSQYIWFRKLYMKFSRYTRVNTFTIISAE